jgi:hypothetical protein
MSQRLVRALKALLPSYHCSQSDLATCSRLVKASRRAARHQLSTLTTESRSPADNGSLIFSDTNTPDRFITRGATLSIEFFGDNHEGSIPFARSIDFRHLRTGAGKVNVIVRAGIEPGSRGGPMPDPLTLAFLSYQPGESTAASAS